MSAFLLSALLATNAALAPTKSLAPDLVITDSAFVEIGGLCLCQGKLVVADEARPALLVFDGAGAKLATIGDKGALKKPAGVACAGGRLLVADELARKVIAFSLEGNVMKEMDGGPDHLFAGPRGLAMDPDGHLLVLDTAASHLYRLDRDGTVQQVFGEKGSGPSQLADARSIVFDPGGSRLYLADSGHSRILIFEAAGAFVGEIGGRGSGPGRLSKNVEGLAFDMRGNLLAVDGQEGYIEVFDPSGRPRLRLGSGTGSAPGKLTSPEGLAYDRATDHLYVADRGNRRVQRFDLGPLFSD